MSLETLKIIFKRDLLKLKVEIESYKEEASLWKVDKSITNSAGNLCLHIVGNLNALICVPFGKTNYIRNREAEFSFKNSSRPVLIKQVDDTIIAIEKSLETIKEADLKNDSPKIPSKEEITTIDYYLTHLATHLSYHLGQVNYHRRFFE
ncbi:DUF1572 family protein [Cellulophaga sp. E16_2]|uniref:DinB superfamily protein n=1 Tax=Cellulophaga algicola (strain DSM 14237 / IC166 / ACAM 630) TaxID=688270 RepID=E6XBG8_CELAD|nr:MULTISPECIES: DUF1572 family protein [Cellulophaga]ADV51081.1 hypothetical protein Celal_3834 [Cellulophaga algicola DSM 14237]MBO0593475.1 DUF1572 family protein [Cellulophaga sp. E16_2]